jgi:hypothetical protein
MPEVILRLLFTTWNGVPVASLDVFVIGGLMYAAMSSSTRSAPSMRRLAAVCRPGWTARRRARSGLRHPKAGAAFGYGSAFHVRLSPREPGSGGLLLGAPGSGKANAATVPVEALALQGSAGVILDPKPSKALAEVVAGVGGTIWSPGGELAWDALPPDPSELANQLVEVLPVDARTKVYRDAARLWVLVAGQALQWQKDRPTVERMAALCRPGGLADLAKTQGRHMGELPRLSQTEQDGVLSMGTSLSILARGVARRSLGTGAGALRLEDAVGRWPDRAIADRGGTLPRGNTDAGRVGAEKHAAAAAAPVTLCDEFARLGAQGRAALELLALGREFGKPVIPCTQGPSDFGELGELGEHALDQAAQDASLLPAFRQGTRDRTTASRLLGVARPRSGRGRRASLAIRRTSALSSSRTCRRRR